MLADCLNDRFARYPSIGSVLLIGSYCKDGLLSASVQSIALQKGWLALEPLAVLHDISLDRA